MTPAGRIALRLSGLLVVALVASGQSAFYLQENDRVTYFCAAGPGEQLFAAWVEAYALTRFPKSNISFAYANCDGGVEEVVNRRPTVIVMTPAARQELAGRLREALPGARLTLIQPARGPVEPAGIPGTITVVKPGELLASVTGAANDPAFDAQLRPGGEAEQLLIAQSILAAWRAAPTVTEVEIDAVGKTARRADNTVVRELAGDPVLFWSQDDAALPMPFDAADPIAGRAVLYSRFHPNLNQQWLRVSGLEAWRYRLTIDGELVGVFTKSELADGVNLATMRTPMSRQAREIGELSRKRQELVSRRSRMLAAPAKDRETPQWRAAFDALGAEEEELVADERAKAQPRTRDYELTPIEQ